MCSLYNIVTIKKDPPIECLKVVFCVTSKVPENVVDFFFFGLHICVTSKVPENVVDFFYFLVYIFLVIPSLHINIMVL